MNLRTFAFLVMATVLVASPALADSDAPTPGTALPWSLGAPRVPAAGGLALMFGSEDGTTNLMGLTLLGGALLLGPSAGHVYAGEWGKAGLFTLGRAVALGLSTFGAAIIVGRAVAGALGSGSTESSPGAAVLFVGAGLAILGIGVA